MENLNRNFRTYTESSGFGGRKQNCMEGIKNCLDVIKWPLTFCQLCVRAGIEKRMLNI